jgi:mannose-6-phosphate isomerase-like protein (cupin superfamily)
MANMQQTPLPISLNTARKLPTEPGRSAEVFVDDQLEVRFTPQPKDGTSHTHDRDELYFVASGRGFYRADDEVTPVSAGDLCFAAAGTVHGFEKFTPDFAIWIIFYGEVKRS